MPSLKQSTRSWRSHPRRQSNFPALKAILSSTVLLGAAFFVGVPAALSSQIFLGGVATSAAPGTSIVIPVMFVSQGVSVSGVQFDLQYDNSALSLAVTVSDAIRDSGKSLYLADLASNKRRFLIAGLNQNSIPDGSLVNLFINVNPNAPAGVYSLKFTGITGTNSESHPVPITSTDGALTVQGIAGQGARLQSTGVLNGASLLSGPVAPGEIITLIGSGLGPASAQQPAGAASSTVLAETSVLFDGTPAPLLYAAPNQINAIVPYAVSGKNTAQLQITSQGKTMATLTHSVAGSAPAMFTTDSTGTGQGAILNQDSTVNSPSNPAEKGSIVTLFATGAGQTDPAGMDGQVTGADLSKPVLPVSVQIGGLDAQVPYAGSAPGLIAGVLQVNVMIPAGAVSGSTVPVKLTVGPASSPAGVTLAIR